MTRRAATKQQAIKGARKAGYRGKKAAKPRRDLHADITGRIVKQLEDGAAPWVQQWTKGNARFSGMPRNAVSKRKYSGINVLLLWLAGEQYASTEWLTFKQAKDLGGSVRKGEKGTEVVFYKKLQYVEQNEETGEDETRTPLMMRSYTVFNVEQCEGLPERYQAKPQAVEKIDRGELCGEFLGAVYDTGAVVRHEGHRAFYQPGTDVVYMPKLEDFQDCAAYQNTLAHELVHWTGHKSRLDRDLSGACAVDNRRAFEELVAELGAAFTASEFGIEGDLRHAGYLASWIKLLKDDPKALFRAASRASKAVEYLYPSSDKVTVSKAA